MVIIKLLHQESESCGYSWDKQKVKRELCIDWHYTVIHDLCIGKCKASDRKKNFSSRYNNVLWKLEPDGNVICTYIGICSKLKLKHNNAHNVLPQSILEITTVTKKQSLTEGSVARLTMERSKGQFFYHKLNYQL